MKLSTLSLAGLLLLALFTMTTTVLAETPQRDGDHQRHGEGRPERGQPRDIAALIEKLQLGDEQAQQFQSLLEKHHGERREMREGDRNNRHELHERHRSEMAEILSDKQLQTLESSRPKKPRRKK